MNVNVLKLRLIVCCLATAWLVPVAVYADTSTIYDNDANAYYGGGDIRYSDGSPVLVNGQPVVDYSADILGGPAYAVDTLAVTRGTDSFTATLTGAYFSSTGLNEWIGDLFLTTGAWNPAGAGPNYVGNNATATGTTWDYVLSIVGGQVSPNGGPATSGQIALYAVNKDNILTTSELPQSGAYRDDQEIEYDATGQAPIVLGTWTLTPDLADPSNGTFTFSLDGLTLADYGLDGVLGLHWAMSCGNDIVEGVVPAAGTVPEPATMVLFGAGLVGLAAYRVRRKENSDL
jgi:hypothetical protein